MHECRLRISRHSAVAAVSSTVITVNLTSNDLNHLKRMTGMPTAPFNTFVRIDASSIDGMNGNAIEAVADGAAVRASSLVVDSTDAELVDFSVAMATNGPPLKLRLTFSETVDIARLDLTKLILQILTDGTNSAGETFRLTGGTVESCRGPSPRPRRDRLERATWDSCAKMARKCGPGSCGRPYTTSSQLEIPTLLSYTVFAWGRNAPRYPKPRLAGQNPPSFLFIPNRQAVPTTSTSALPTLPRQTSIIHGRHAPTPPHPPTHPNNTL